MPFNIIKNFKSKIWEKFRHRNDGLGLALKYTYHFLTKIGVPGLQYEYIERNVNEYYGPWYAKHMAVSSADRANIAKHIGLMREKTLISILMPARRDSSAKWLRKAIESTLNQLYPHFELCVAADKGSECLSILEKYAAKDKRIKLTFGDANTSISEASNSALKIAKGEFIALLDNDDQLTEDALYHLASVISQNPKTDLIYSDEDKIDAEENVSDPYFKPDWSPDLMRSHNFIRHSAVFRRSVLEKIGGFRKDFEGAHEWDLCLRFIEQIADSSIVHIPRVLCHRRATPGSTSQSPGFKSDAMAAAKKTLQDFLNRKSQSGSPKGICEPQKIPSGTFRVRYQLKSEPLVSLIILTRDKLSLLKKCIDSILQKTTYKNYEIIIVDNGSAEKKTLNFLEQITQTPKVKVIRRDIPFNFSQLNNEAASQAKGEILGLVNNDIEVIEPDWMGEMASHAARPEIGAVGARLLYPDNKVQHVGAILGVGPGIIAHPHKGADKDNIGHGGRIKLVHNLSAVTAACLFIRKKIYLEVRGLEESLKVACNDIDFCLKVREAGYLNLYTPHAELFHHESKTRGHEDTPSKKARYNREAAYMKQKWGATLYNDPYYNPNFTLKREDFSLADSPRTIKPWEHIELEKPI